MEAATFRSRTLNLSHGLFFLPGSRFGTGISRSVFGDPGQNVDLQIFEKIINIFESVYKFWKDFGEDCTRFTNVCIIYSERALAEVKHM